jgi:ribonuclease VapC
MGLNIKNREAHLLAEELSKLTGESMTTAVTIALRERLARVRQQQGLSLADRLLAIGRDCAARLKEPFRSADHGDLLYDERGLPRWSSIRPQIAILRDEPEASSCAHAIENSAVRRVSAANFVETAVIIDASRDPVASRRFDDLIKEAQIIIEPVTEPQARIAREAYRDFGKGSSHPAKLNFGDCFAYALAKFTSEPLLFKGDDFAHTDIRPAIHGE